MGLHQWPKFRGIEKVSAEDLSALDDMCRAEGIDPDELAAIMSIESGFRPSAVFPKNKAGGLIGFLPSTLRLLGYTGTPEQFQALSFVEQLPYVAAFYRLTTKRRHVPGDLYLGTFYPAALGTADDHVIARPGDGHVYDWNKGLAGSDGLITSGSVRGKMLSVLARAHGKGWIVPGHTESRVPNQEQDTGQIGVLVLAAAGLGLWYWHKKRNKR